MSLRIQVLAGLKWTVLGRLASQVVTWAVTIYVIRLLSPEDYGLMALATIFSALFTLLAEIGLGSTLVQTKDLPTEKIRQILGLIVLSNGAACILMAVVVAPLVAFFFGESRLQLVIQIIALQFIPAAFSVVPAALLERELHFRGRSISDFCANVGGSMVILALAYLGYGVFALAWGSLSIATIRAIGLNISYPFARTPLFRFTGCGSMLNFGSHVAMTQFIWFLYTQADSFIIGKLLGKHDLGIYSVSMDLASLPTARASASLNQVVFPALSKIQRDGGVVGPYLLKGLRTLSIVTFPIMWGISSVAPEIVGALLGEKWLEAVLPLALLCLIMPLRVLTVLVSAGLQSVGRADIGFQNICTAAATMCIALVGGAQFGLTGVSMTWVLIFPVTFLINLRRSSKHLNLSTRELLAPQARPAIACGLMYGTIALVRLLLPWSSLTNLLVLVAVGAVTYTGFTFVFNREGLAEARNLMRRRSN